MIYMGIQEGLYQNNNNNNNMHLYNAFLLAIQSTLQSVNT